MANYSPPPLSFVALVLLLLSLLLITSAAAVGVNSNADSEEITSALEALRNHDYTLFANAIATSDLQYQLLTTVAGGREHGPISSFTLFAPKDELLFALDMATDAVVYVNTLRYHTVPNHRLTFSDLQNLSSPFLGTLLPHYSLLIGKVLDSDVSFENAALSVVVDGVRISTPDIFLGSRIAVHGIDGILLSGLNVHQDFGGSSNETSSPVAPASPPDGNIPVAAAPKAQDKIEKLKNFGRKKRGRHHWEGRHHHRRHSEVGDHPLGDP